MVITTGQTPLMGGKLHDLLECAETLSKLNKSNMEKDMDLAKMSTNSNNARNSLHLINNDIQTLEKENIRLKEEIQSYLDKQNYEELRSVMTNDSVNKKLTAFRIEILTIAEVLGLDLDRIRLDENDLMITFQDSQHTTLVFEESQEKLKLVSISPAHPNFEVIQQQLQRTGDFVGLIISLYKIRCSSS